MAAFAKFVLINIAIILTHVVLTTSVEHIEPTKACTDKCSEEKSPLNDPNTAEFRSCSRGCRFYVLSSFTKKLGRDVFTPVVDICVTNCGDAYPYHESTYSNCVKGCKFQDESKNIDLENAQPIAEEESSFLSRIHSATPIMQVRKVISEAVGRFQVLTTQVLTYFVRDDKTLIAVQSEPEVLIQPLPRDYKKPEPEQNSALKENKEAPFFIIEREEALVEEESPNETVTRVALDSRRYTYLMHSLLLLAGVSLSFVGISYCLALARHQQRKTLKAANINLALQQEPLKLVRPEDLTKLSLMEEDPLPSKQGINLSQAKV